MLGRKIEGNMSTMRFPRLRVRFTARRLMLIVAIVAVVMGCAERFRRQWLQSPPEPGSPWFPNLTANWWDSRPDGHGGYRHVRRYYDFEGGRRSAQGTSPARILELNYHFHRWGPFSWTDSIKWAITRLVIADGFDVRLMPAAKSTDEMPTSGRSLVVVAEVNNLLHFRIFDGAGEMIEDSDESMFPKCALWMDDLSRLVKLWGPPHVLTRNDQDSIISLVRSFAGRIAKGGLPLPEGPLPNGL